MTRVRIQLGSTYHDADGNAHGPGSEIELDDAIAKALIDGGSALACVTAAPAPAPDEIYAVADVPGKPRKTR